MEAEPARPLDTDADEVQDGEHSRAHPFDTGGDEWTAGKLSRRRRPASIAEQKRRKDWGDKWGKLVSEAVKEAIEGTR